MFNAKYSTDGQILFVVLGTLVFYQHVQNVKHTYDIVFGSLGLYQKSSQI